MNVPMIIIISVWIGVDRMTLDYTARIPYCRLENWSKSLIERFHLLCVWQPCIYAFILIYVRWRFYRGALLQSAAFQPVQPVHMQHREVANTELFNALQ